MKHYVIAGGAGFLGANLIKRLIDDNGDIKITILDNLHTGRKQNIEKYLALPNVTFIKHDITKPIKIDGKIDYVINLACPASPPKYYEDPVHTLETSALGTKNMLDLALEKKARFFHTSTSEIYGDPKEHPQKETYFGNVEPYCKRSCYDEGKRYAEALIHHYRHALGVNTGLIRIFNTYGPMMDPEDGRVVTNFILQALSGKDITIHGDGSQTRSFCYVDDQVEGMIRMIHSDEEGPINIGNPGEFTVESLADLVIELTRSDSKKVYVEAASSDPKVRKPDISMAKQKLGWEPKISLRQGLVKTIEWFGGPKHYEIAMREYIRNGRLIKPVIVSIPSRAALAGNPSDLAVPAGIGAVISIPVRDFVGTVSFSPSSAFRVVGPEMTATTLQKSVQDIVDQGFNNGEHLIRAAIATFGEMVKTVGVPLDETAVPMTISWETNIPRQRGMSGSSSLIIATLKGLLRIFGLENHEAFRPELLADWALGVETKLGISAGLQDRVLQCFADHADAVFMDFSKEAFAHNKNEHGDYFTIKAKYSLPKMALLLSSRPSHSGIVHEPIRKKIAKKDTKTIGQMKELVSYAHEVKEALLASDWKRMGKAMDKNAQKRVEIYGDAFGEINLSMLSACKKAGCPANFTGSGGAMVAILPEKNSLKKLKEELAKDHDDEFEIYEIN